MQYARGQLLKFLSRPDRTVLAALEPRRLVPWLYVARLSIATVILIAALTTWKDAPSDKTFVATLCFFFAIVFTTASFVWTEVNQRPLTEGFFYGHLVADLLIVTAVVHVTGGAVSGFAALYILVNASASLLLPIGGTLLVALLGLVMYGADAVYVARVAGTLLDLEIFIQIGVVSLVAVITGYISGRLRETGRGREQLVAELVGVRLREKDILRNIKSGIITVDATGGLLFANPSASDLTGIELEERIGQPIVRELRAVAPVLGEALDLAINGGVHVSRTEGQIAHHERSFPLGVTTTSSDGDGRHVGRTITAIFQDISDQKRLEQLNLRAHRLEAVAELSASLAHEIKNPLASIRSAVEQMSSRPAATDDERTLGNLIVRESDRLSRLLSEFLDFARVRVTRRDTVDLAAVVKDAAALAGSHPAAAGTVTLEVQVGTAPLIIQGDEDLLHRAVFNLVLNAIQASRPGTAVRLVAAEAKREQLPTGVPFPLGAISIQIIDSGLGIPLPVQNRLFEPFTTTKPGGSGLGLAIAHRAIEAHKGVVLVDTNERGTRFTVLLPRTDAGVIA